MNDFWAIGQRSPCFAMCGRALCQRFGCLRATSDEAIVERYEHFLAEIDRLREAAERLREELMRVGLLAVPDRQDGCINKTTAERIRTLAHRACWPEEGGS